MVIKIFFEDKPVFLCDEITPGIRNFMHQPDTIYVEDISPKGVKSLLHEIAKPAVRTGILFNNDMVSLKESFFKQFTLIQAAGGVVKNELKEVLFIFRRGKWDLPKGKNDANETAEDCALREVMEETGLKDIKAGKKLLTTYHTYSEFGKHILKETDWFDMKVTIQQVLVPQHEEGIEKIEWVSEVNVVSKLQNSFPLILDVLVSAGIYGKP